MSFLQEAAAKGLIPYSLEWEQFFIQWSAEQKRKKKWQKNKKHVKKWIAAHPEQARAISRKSAKRLYWADPEKARRSVREHCRRWRLRHRGKDAERKRL